MASDIYYFNPTAEMAVANGIYSYQPPELLQTFESDMAAIMLFFAGPEDVVIVNEHPSPIFLKRIKDIKPELPRFLTLDELTQSGETFNRLIPWGWSPVVYRTLEPVLPLLSNEFKESLWHSWSDNFKHYFDRNTSKKVLETILKSKHAMHGDQILIQPVYTSSVKVIETELKTRKQLVLKAPFSSSGRGIQMLRKDTLNHSLKAWIESILEKQNGVMLENLLDKTADFSLHFEFKADSGPEYLGHVFFKTSSNGQFHGCYLREHPVQEINRQIEHYLSNDVIAIIKVALMEHYKEFQGFLGIDAMLIHTTNGPKIHPCVEINPRLTMGLLTLKLRQLIDSNGYWQMFFKKNGDLKPCDSVDYHQLTPISRHTRFTACLQISD